MRLLVVALVLVLTLMYFTFGLRFGYVTLTPTYMLNATGTSRYTFEIYDEKQRVGVEGSCKVSRGQAVFRLTDAKGVQVAGQVCPRGAWGLKMLATGDSGRYVLEIDFKKFTGIIDLAEARE